MASRVNLLLGVALLLATCVQEATPFSVLPTSTSFVQSQHQFASSRFTTTTSLSNDATEGAEDEASLTKEQKEEVVGNLVADDEWEGLGMELTELVRVAVVEDLKKNAKDFLGKDDYKIGDITKEIDTRVKTEVAKVRGKDEYELGDFVMAMDEMSKGMTEELTGKPYEAGDLSVELDTRIKSAVADYCGKDEYEFGDLSKEVSTRVQSRVAEFTGKGDYEFGDITKEIETRRRAWVKDYLGEEAASNYQFGDITKKALTSFTGKDDYEFGDVTKKVLGSLFGPRKRKK